MRPLTKTPSAFAAFLLLLFCTRNAVAQKNSIKGTVVDTTEKKNLQHAIVSLIRLTDTTLYLSIRSDEEGQFLMEKVPAGRYTIMVSYPKMADYLKDITVTDSSSIKLDKIPMITQAKLLEEVVVTAGKAIRMRGDTLEFTADSFAVRPGSNVEELLKRLPGIYMERNGKIYAQGKEVEKVLVDGDEFFSDDPGLAAKYLRADAIDKVQVFDQKSEQTEFTGVDDGKRTKTINLKLKKSKKNGSFGKLSTGSNGGQYYQHEAMGALFTNSRKISVFGLSSRGGATQMDYNDMSKYVNQDYEMIDDGTGSIIYHSTGDGDDYFNSDGLPSLQYGGAHFSDKWNDSKQKVFANYRIKQTKVSSWNTSSGNAVYADGRNFRNTGSGTSNSYGFFQKASGSLALSLDSFSTVKISMNGRLGNGNRFNSNRSASENEKGFMVNKNESSNLDENETRNFGSNITYQKKFRKEGRTLSMVFQQDYSNRTNNVFAISATQYFDPATGNPTNKDSLNQLQQTRSPYQSYAARAQFTEALSKTVLVSAEYGWKKAITSNVFNTFNNNNGKFDQRVDSLSNDFDFSAVTHITGASFTWHNKKLSVNAGGKAFFTRFDQQNNDLAESNTRRFVNWAPSVNATIRIKQNGSVRAAYSGETIQPMVDQLQPLRRSSNQLYTVIGNPDLKPSFRHSVSASYTKFDFNTGSSLFGGVSMSVQQNSIASQSYIDVQNRTVSQFINIKGLPNINMYINHSWQWKKWHLRPSVNVNANRWGNYTIQNGSRLKTESWNVNTVLMLYHDWKDKMKTSYSARLGYNIGKSNIPGQKANNTFTHSHNISTSVYLPWEFEIGTNCDFSFQPKNSTFNTNFNNIIWNASLEKKFLKNREGVVKLAVNDLLNRKIGYNRWVNGSSSGESDRFVIKRYFMLSATWNFARSL